MFVLSYEHVFDTRLILIGAVLLGFILVTLGAARPSSGAAPETRVGDPVGGGVVGDTYVITAGDTLWAIAVDRYGGDLREAVWRIQERNDLHGEPLQPGQVLVLP